MGKQQKRGTRTLTPAQLARKEAARKERKRKRRIRIGKLVALIGAGVIVAGAVTVTTLQLLKRGGVFLRSHTAAKTEHYAVDQAMLSYFFDQCYDSYLDYNKDNLDAVGLDLSKKLKSQDYDDNQTWYEMFMDNTMKGVVETLQMCETAYQHGFSLTDAQKADCQTRAEQLDRSDYPTGVKVSDIAKSIELSEMAQSYRKQYVDAISISDDDIAQQYVDFPEKYLTWSAYCFSVAWTDTVANDGDLTREQAKAYVDQFAAAKDADDFVAQVKAFLTDVKKKESADVESALQSMTVANIGSAFSEEVADWAMNPDTKVGSTLTTEGEQSQLYTAYLLLSEPERNESETADFHVICLPDAAYETPEAALSAVEQLKAEWQEAGATVAAFETIAKRESQDSASYQQGGKVVGYDAQKSTYGDGIHDWLFDAARKTGDCIVTSAEDAAIFAYFDAQNAKQGWQIQAYNDLYKKATTALDDENNLHLVTQDAEVIAGLDY